MTATIELLDAVSDWFGEGKPASDYRLASDYFHVSPQRVSSYRTGRKSFSDARVIKICGDLWPGDEDAKAHWLARVHADREQNVQVRRVWERIAKMTAAAAFLLALPVLWQAPPAVASTIELNHVIYYAKLFLVAGLASVGVFAIVFRWK